MNSINSETEVLKQNNYKGFLIDLIIYISVMFAIREVSIPNTNFLVTGLFWSFTTLIVATWRMRVRGVTWKELGLRKPKRCKNYNVLWLNFGNNNNFYVTL